MAIPGFLAELRALVGTRLMWLPGTTAVVLDEQDRVLLNLRRDDNTWSLIGGILEPGEEPADCVVRECLEETGVLVEPEALVHVGPSPVFHYPSGDQCHYLDLTFRCRPLAGEARVADDESLDVGWFGVSDFEQLDLDPFTRRRIDAALRCTTTTFWQPPQDQRANPLR